MNALELLMTEWKSFDVKMNVESFGGYTPALPVIANRLAGQYEMVLRTLAETVRADAWMERASEYAGRTFNVGFRDNQDAEAYNDACRRLATMVRALGWKVRLHVNPTSLLLTRFFITLPASIEQDAADAYAPYLQALGKMAA